MSYIYGNGDNESLVGSSGADTIYGAGGDDTLVGGDGADYIWDTEGANVLYGDSEDPSAPDGGDDFLTGGLSNSLYGGAGNDWLRATGSSSLVGGAGNDVLEGGTNVNALEGGSGADTIRGTGTILTDSAGDSTRVGGDEVEIALSNAQAYGAYDVLDFKAGASGDVLNLQPLLVELVPAGFDYRNPLIDQAQFAETGARVVTGTNSWMRIVQVGPDVEIQVDPSGPGNGSSYQTVVVLRGVTVSELQPVNFDPPFSLDGVLLDADIQASGRVLTLDGNDTVTDNAGPGYPDVPGVTNVNSHISTGYGNDRIVLNGGWDTVYGGVGADTIQGSLNGGGIFHGEQGDDVIDMPASASAYGGDGNDTITGGAGDDTLDGGMGHDVLSSGDRNDYLYGGDGRDTLDGGSGRDYLEGGAGDDRLVTGVTDVVYSTDPLRGYLLTYQELAAQAGDENDYLSGGNDSDTLIAGAGNDNLYDTHGANIIFAGSGNDQVTAGVSNWVDAGSGNDWVEVGASSTVTGGEGDDTLRIAGLSVQADGGAGNDRFEMGNPYWGTHGAGVLTLGAGSDTVVFSLPALANGATPLEVTDFVTGAGGDVLDVSALLGGLRNYTFDNPFLTGHLRLQAAANGQDTILQVDVGGPSDGANWQDVAVVRNTTPGSFTHDNFLPPRLYPGGNATPETFSGDGAPDTYIGLEGADSAQGFGGNDLLDGGFGGSDTLIGGAGADTLFGFGGNDVLYGDTPDNAVAGAGDVIVGGAGDDLIYGGDGDDNGYVGTYKGVNHGWPGLDGGTGNDTVYGEAGRDQLYGREGNDSLDGGADHDSLEGGEGNDTLDGGAGDDYLYDYSPQQGVDRNLLQGGTGADRLYAYYGIDTLEGGDDNDYLYSLSQQATLRGGAGDDELVVDRPDSANRLEGGEGNDVLYTYRYWGDQGNDTFDGGAGNDTIFVTGGGNLIAGGSGADTINLEPYEWSRGSGEIYLAALPDAMTPGVTPTDTEVDIVRLSLRAIEDGRAAPLIHDFHVGQGGDKLDLTAVLGRLSQLGYTFGNPFTTGWLRLFQDGTDLRVQADTSGPSDGESWSDVAMLQGVDLSTEDARIAMLTYNFTTSFGVNGVSIVGTEDGETISDSVGVNDVFAGDGSDSIQGLGGDDLLDGGFGGDDTLVGGAGRDTLFGFDGNDVLYGDTQDGSVPGDQDDILGGAGDDLVYGGDGDDNGYVGPYKGVDYGWPGLDGGAGNDTVHGEAGRDQLYGREGNDSLDGGADNDSLDGGEGDDTLAGGAGDDYLYDYSAQQGVDHNLLQGGTGADRLYAYYGVDTLEGGDDNDYLYSLSQQSTLRGDAGDDELVVDRPDSANRLEGGDGNDVLYTYRYWGDQGNDTFDGGAGNDTIYVTGNANLVAGGSGADTIDLEPYDWSTGTATIYLAGLPDAASPDLVPTDSEVDVVRLSLRALEAGRAIPEIHDFHTGDGGDKLDLTPVLGRLNALGYPFNNPFTNGWLRLKQVGSDTWLQVDTSGPANGENWLDLAVLRNTAATSFNADNFSPRMSPIGFGTGQVITGTEQDETISDSVGIAGAYAGDGSDSLAGLAGHDLLDGGFGGNDTLVGGAGRDTLFGFDGNDVLYGDTQDDSVLGDQDVILGGAGDDLLYGGDGDDNGYVGTYKGVNYGWPGLDGGSGNDTVYGGDGRDQLYGREGNDSLDGGADNDSLDGGDGSDTLAGGAGDDYLYDYSTQQGVDHNLLQGGTGADRLYAYYGVDTLEGGDDNDYLYSLSQQATLRGDAGDDELVVDRSDSANWLEGGEGNDVLYNYKYWGDQGNDTFDGGAGNDTIYVTGNANLVAGGSGADAISLEPYEWSNGSATIYLAGLPDAGSPGTVPSDGDVDTVTLSLRAIEGGRAAAHIHDFHTGAGGDRLDLAPVLGRLHAFGYTFENPFTSGWLRLLQDGADTRLQVDTTGPGNGASWRDLAVLHDTVASSFTQHNFTPRIAPAGLPDAQVITGAGLDETITESAGIGGVFAGDGSDSIDGLGGNDFLDGGFGGSDTLVGGVGRDTLFGFDGNDVLYGDTPDNSATGDDDVIVGGAGDDLIFGGDGNDNGYAGNYIGVNYGWAGLDGGRGNDTVYGGDGRDQLYGREGDDSLDGGADNDSLDGGEGSDTLEGGTGDDYLYDYSAQQGVDHNLLQGGTGADRLYAYYGVDTLEGGDDNDYLYSLSQQATLRGGAGDDELVVDRSDSANRLEGGEGNDVLYNYKYWGDQGGDTFDGGAGNDTIYVTGNANLVAGGSGADTIDLEPYEWTNGTGRVYLAGLPEAASPDTVPTDSEVDVVRPSLRGVEGGRPAVVVYDFHTGIGGDRMDLSAVAGRLTQLGMAEGADPFAAGFLRFTPAGTDAILEADLNGAEGGSQFRAIAVFKGTSASAFVADNVVQGFVPLASGNAAAPTVQPDKTLFLLEDSVDNPLELTPAFDPDGGAVTITVDAVPYGSFETAAGTTVSAGQALSVEELTGLTYTPYADWYGDAGVFRYSVADEEGSVVTAQVGVRVANVQDAPRGTLYVYGTLQVGQTIYVSNGVWDPDGTGPAHYQWLADGQPITDATEWFYVLTADEAGKAMSVRVTFVDSAGQQETATSDPTGPVLAINNPPTGEVHILVPDGHAVPAQGDVLAVHQTLADADGLGALAYQWFADGMVVGTGSTFTPGQGEVGRAITVTVSYTDNAGFAESVGSEPTQPVTDVNDAPQIAEGIHEVAAATAGSTSAVVVVADLLSSAGWSDADPGASGGIAVTATSGGGSWQYSLDGSTWTVTPPTIVTTALLLSGDTMLRYVTAASDVGFTATLTYRAWDQTSGTASGTDSPAFGDASAGGGSSAFSALEAQVGVPVLGSSTGLNLIVGTPGPDALSDTPADDELQGLGGNDSLYGSDGNDLLVGGVGDDYFSDALGSNTVLGGDGDDLIALWGWDEAHANTATGGAGRDTYELANALTVLTITDFAVGPQGDVLRIQGLLANSDYQDANPFAQGILQLVQEGPDALLQFDADGADGTAFGWSTKVRLAELDAATVTLFNFDFMVPPDGSSTGLLLEGTPEADSLHGTLVDDTIFGLEGDDALHGFAGDDSLDGGAGADQVHGDSGNDILVGGSDSGYDHLYGGAGDDYLASGLAGALHGDAGNDTLVGNSEATTAVFLDGGEGFDLLMGGAGNDYIADLYGSNLAFGGAGNDVFELWSSNPLDINTATGDAGRDIFKLTGSEGLLRVMDFSAGQSQESDVLDLRTLLWASGYEGTSAFGDGYLRLVQDGTDAVLQWDRDGAGANDWGWLSQVRLVNVDANTLTLDNLDPGLQPVVSVNAAPEVALPPPDVEWEAGFQSLTLAAGTFVDADASDRLALSARLQDGIALPEWLTFDPSTATFQGTAPEGDGSFLDIVVTATDTVGASASDVFRLTLLPSNRPPTGTVLVEGTAMAGTTLTAVAAFDDPDGLPLAGSFAWQWYTGAGAIEGATGTSLALTLDQVGQHVWASATYVDLGGATEVVTSDFTAPVGALVAIDDAVDVAEDGAVDVFVLANDTVVGGIDVFSGVSQATSGTVTVIDAASGLVRYTPNADFHGTDSFTYTTTLRGVVQTATVGVLVEAVNDDPVALADSLAALEDSPAPVPVTTLLANDTDIDGDTLGVIEVGNALHGTVRLEDGLVIFTPDPDLFGHGAFTYTVSDGQGGFALGTVLVDIGPVDDPAVFTGDVEGSGDEDTTIRGTLVAQDVDGMAAPRYAVHHQAASGVVAIDELTGAWSYTPAADFNGTDSFGVSVMDDQDNMTVRDIAVTVLPVADAVVDRNVVDEDGQLATHVLANDTFEGATPALVAVGQAAHGTVVIVDAGAGLVSYTPEADYVGADSYTYTVVSGGASETSTVQVSVLPVNDAPTGGITITGMPVAGQTLAASSTLADVDGIPASGTGALAWQWYADGEAIAGATGESYTLTLAEVAKNVTVGASYVDLHGQAESVASSAVLVQPAGLALSGMAYHWKSHVLLKGMTVTAADTASVAAGDGLFDLRGAQYDATDHSVSVQVWVNPAQATGSLDFAIGSDASARLTFTSTLGVDWELLAEAHSNTSMDVGAMLSNTELQGVTGALQVGTLKVNLQAGVTAANVNFTNVHVGQEQVASFGMGFGAQLTDADGLFRFETLPASGYQLAATRPTADSGNAVTSADALAALRMAVGINPNLGTATQPALKVSPYQVIAADANEDGKVTSADALAILRMAVKSPLAPAQKWLFVDEGRDLWNEVTQSSLLTRTDANWNRVLGADLQQDMVANLVGVLRGDVNGSWAAPSGSTDLDALQPNYFQDLAVQLGVPLDVWGIG